MDELHFLIEKWEHRLSETASETVDEKIEILLKQVVCWVWFFLFLGAKFEGDTGDDVRFYF